MDHNESNTKICWTQDYGKFRFLHGNRDLDESKIKKLEKDVKAGMDLFKFCPILVNESMYIIDGQHRFYVCQRLKINVYYIVVPDFSLAQIARLNNNQNRWKMNDFLNCFIDSGKNKEEYKILQQFKKKHKVSISMAAGMLANGTLMSKFNTLENFRNGMFVAKHLSKAEKLMERAQQFEPYIECYYERNFLLALEKLHDNGKFNQAEMLGKLKKHDLKIEKQPNTKSYLAHMEELFNYKNSIRKTIY